MQQPSTGRIVHFFPTVSDVQARTKGSSEPVAAIVAGVLDKEKGEVNLTIFPNVAMGPVAAPRVSVPHKSSVEQDPEFNQGLVAYWDWPERV